MRDHRDPHGSSLSNRTYWPAMVGVIFLLSLATLGAVLRLLGLVEMLVEALGAG